MDDFKVKAKAMVQRVPMPVWYILAIIGAVFSYTPAREQMIIQDAWIYIVQSPITLNFVLIFFMWGLATDHIAKRKGWDTNSGKAWALFAIGLALLILFFKFVGGYPTSF